MLDSQLLIMSFKMDSRMMWIVFIVCVIGSTQGRFEDRNMTDCLKVGLQCSRWGSCKFNMTSSKLICFCVNGFKGHLCDEDRNECDRGNAPCNRRGVCHNSVGSFRCDCVPGWHGPHCHRHNASVSATCPVGYAGANCTDDLDECTLWTANPCEHGTCTNTPGNFTCNCTTGWEGKICNEDIDECTRTSGLCHSSGNCTNIPGDYACECPYPYNGTACYGSNDNADDSDTNIWVIIGPVIGIIVIAGIIGVGMYAYKKTNRTTREVNAGNETEVETINPDSTTGAINAHNRFR